MAGLSLRVSMMMIYVLGMSNSEDTYEIVQEGIMTKVSFCIFGCLPVFADIVASTNPMLIKNMAVDLRIYLVVAC